MDHDTATANLHQSSFHHGHFCVAATHKSASVHRPRFWGQISYYKHKRSRGQTGKLPLYLLSAEPFTCLWCDDYHNHDNMMFITGFTIPILMKPGGFKVVTKHQRSNLYKGYSSTPIKKYTTSHYIVQNLIKGCNPINMAGV